MNWKCLHESLKRCFGALLLLGCATAMLAGEPALREKEVRGNAKPRTEAPLLLVLPSQLPANAQLDLSVMEGPRTLVRELFALPAAIPDGATIDVLATHAEVLKTLRTKEGEAAGSLRLVAKIGTRTIADESFGKVDTQSRRLSLTSALGEPREVEVRLHAKTPRKVGALTKDPGCEDDCYQQYLACYERCDERGDSCAICSRQWSECVYYCPDVCTEPKSVSTYDVYVAIGAAHFNTFSCASYFLPSTWGDLWEHVYAYYTIYTYQRTEHCDGTYTDVLIGTSPAQFWCWYDTYQQCSPAVDYPPFDVCP